LRPPLTLWLRRLRGETVVFAPVLFVLETPLFICSALINIHIMRPRFLGDQPPTAQFLNDITQVLSLKLTCVRLLLLTKAFCAGIVSSSSLGEDAREEKENADAPPPKPPPLTLKDLTDETTSRETIEICTRLIETIVRGAVRYELDANELRNELEQLGLPKVSFTSRI